MAGVKMTITPTTVKTQGSSTYVGVGLGKPAYKSTDKVSRRAVIPEVLGGRPGVAG